MTGKLHSPLAGWLIVHVTHTSTWERTKRYTFILYFVDGASRYRFLLITKLTHFFMYLFISSLYMFRASQCSSSGDRIVLIHHLVWLVCVSDCLVCRSGGNFLTGIPSSHLHRLIIPDDVLIQFDLLMMSTVMLVRRFPPDRHTKQPLTQTNHTRWCINTIRSPDDEHCDVQNM